MGKGCERFSEKRWFLKETEAYPIQPGPTLKVGMLDTGSELGENHYFDTEYQNNVFLFFEATKIEGC
jgi:hypothetical protein